MKLKKENREKLENIYCEWRCENWDTYEISNWDIAMYGVEGVKDMADEDLMEWYKSEIVHWI